MIRSERFKYCAYDRGPVLEQLFDLERDPGEQCNLAVCSDFDDVLGRHRGHLREWIDTHNDPFGIQHYAFPGRRLAVPGEQWTVDGGESLP